jgi:ankyrin repeat protein
MKLILLCVCVCVPRTGGILLFEELKSFSSMHSASLRFNSIQVSLATGSGQRAVHLAAIEGHAEVLAVLLDASKAEAVVQVPRVPG